MDSRTAIRTIHATLIQRGFREVGPGIADYEGTIKVHGKPVEVSVSIPDLRFARKPQIFLKDRSQIPLDVLAHVETETGICYSSGAGLPLDLHEPGQAILRVLEEAQRTLELSYRGRGIAEMVDEYQHYWYPKLGVKTFLPRNSADKSVSVQMFFAAKGDEPDFLCIAPTAALRGFNVAFPVSAQVRYIDGLLGPASDIGAPGTLAELETWFKAQVALKGQDWERTLDWMAQGHALFVAAPNALLGVRLRMPQDITAGLNKGSIRREKLPAIVRAKKAGIEVERFAGTWCNIGDIALRNNANGKNLIDVSVAVVGCGTIGSHLARMLVQNGAGGKSRLTLFDNQTLSEGNIGRHLLGFESVGKPKASELKKELERFHPQVQVEAYCETALEHWKVLAGHDLVIDATGEWNIQSALNALFLHESERPKAMLHSWVFMNGAGAQSFLNLRDEFGCFRCLKPDFGGSWRFPAGREDDELNLQPASCGDGSFVPFSVDASVIAASLASRAALDWAGGSPGARLRSQVVDLDRGIYQKPRSPSPANNCPACSSMRGTS